MRRLKRSFKKEFKWQVKYALVSAIGFTIAFAWRNAIFDAFQNFVSRFLDVPIGHYLSEVYTAIFITLIGVIAIFAASKLLQESG